MRTPEDPAAGVSPSSAPARRRRGSPMDLLRSLGLVGLAVLGMVAFSLFNQPRHPPVTVDVPATVQAARSGAAYPVLAMTHLPRGWYANYAEVSGVRGSRGAWTFHIGYVTDDEQFFAVDESSTNEPASTPAGAVRTELVAGLRFSVFIEHAKEVWVHEASTNNNFVITLTGSGSLQQWRTFVGALRADGPTAS